RPLTARSRRNDASDSCTWYPTRSSRSMLLAGEQLPAPYVATWTAVFRSWLVPPSMARSTVSDSATPPAQDWMSVFIAARKSFMSAARCDREGSTAIPTSPPATSTSSPAANHQRGVLLVGQPEWRRGTEGGSARGGGWMGVPQPVPPGMWLAPLLRAAWVIRPEMRLPQRWRQSRKKGAVSPGARC